MLLVVYSLIYQIMKNERAFGFISLIVLSVLTVGQFFSLVEKEFDIQRLEQKLEYTVDRLEKVERHSHGH